MPCSVVHCIGTLSFCYNSDMDKDKNTLNSYSYNNQDSNKVRYAILFLNNKAVSARLFVSQISPARMQPYLCCLLVLHR